MDRLRCGLALVILVFAFSLFAGKPAPPPPGPEPDWEVVYVSSSTDRMALVLTVADGSQSKVLHSVRNVSDTGPSFTPDGRHVVFTSNIGGVDGIYAIRLKNALGQPSIGSPTLLTTVTPWSRSCHPTVSPEGVLAFADRESGSTIPDLHLMGVIVDAGGDLRADPQYPRRNVTGTPELYEVWPSWSIADPPSARRLGFTRYGEAATITCDRFVCSAAMPVPLNLGPDLSISTALGWSKLTPGLVSFGYTISNTGTAADLYFVDLDDPQRQGKLTDTPVPYEWEPVWAPQSDNRILAFAQRRQDGLVIFEDILTRMISGPGGAETTLAMPSKTSTQFEEPDWRR